MIICQCAAVSAKTIAEAVANGATDEAAVAEMCGAGGECGTCIPAVREIVVAIRLRRLIAA